MSASSVKTEISPEVRAALLEEWIAIRRAMIERDGSVVRGGPGCTTIEVQLMHKPGHVFQPINSPDGRQHFGTVEARDAIVRRLQGQSA